MFDNHMPRYEILSPGDLDMIEHGWRRIVSELGIRFDHPEVLERFAAAGQTVQEDVVLLDPDFLLEQVALAPAEFTLRARNPNHSVVLGGHHMVFTPVSGAPFFRLGDVRRDGTLADFELMARLTQSFEQLDICTMPSIEPNDRPLDSRHLEMLQVSLTTSDKAVFGSALSEVNAADSIEMVRIAFGGGPLDLRDEEGRPACSLMTIVNVNSPLNYDSRMLEALLAYAAAGQGLVVTPFLLMGAMAPVTSPAALAQQTAEALAGVALIQLVRPETPAVMGSFLSTIDMQSGSPAFGGPESAKGLYASGQIARRYGLPWRAGGGSLTSSQTVDAQAAQESFNTLQAAFLAGANLVVQSAGWLESGLVACPEKLVVDVEALRVLREQFTPVVVDEEALAFDAHKEVRHAGHFLGAEHTLTRFRNCFYRPLLSSTENFERWVSKGSRDTSTRAAEIWQAIADAYVAPPVDDAVRAKLAAFVDRRRNELGD